MSEKIQDEHLHMCTMRVKPKRATDGTLIFLMFIQRPYNRDFFIILDRTNFDPKAVKPSVNSLLTCTNRRIKLFFSLMKVHTTLTLFLKGSFPPHENLNRHFLRKKVNTKETRKYSIFRPFSRALSFRDLLYLFHCN